MANQPIEVGGPYAESDDHVPNPTDMVKQFNTSGIGAHGKIEEVSPVFEVDKVKTAAEIVAALDPDNDTVSDDKVLLPDPIGDNEAAVDLALARAERRLEQGVVIGEATPAEREAALEGDEGTLAAVEQERSNAAANSTGSRTAGQHEGAVSTGEAGKDDTALVGAGNPSAYADAQSGSDSAKDADVEDEEEGDKYDEMDHASLQSEVKSRNEGREEADQIKPDGRSSEDLKAALRKDDEA